MNNVTLLGRMAADPELKTTQSGKYVTSFAIAVSRGTDGTDWIDIVAWEKTAEFICNYFNKGKQIALIGSIQTRSYTDKNGGKRKAVEVVANKVFFAGDKGGDKGAKVEQQEEQFSNVSNNDDLPF